MISSKNPATVPHVQHPQPASLERHATHRGSGGTTRSGVYNPSSNVPGSVDHPFPPTSKDATHPYEGDGW
jgi:hypothetical protein